MTTIRTALAAAALAASIGAGHAQEALMTGDASAGEGVFRRCQACHAVGEGAVNKVGPQLNELFGRVPAGLEDYAYSGAMEEYGENHVWDVATLAEYLRAPRKVVRGTKMAFAGLRKDEDIADVLAYLAQFDPEGMETGQ